MASSKTISTDGLWVAAEMAPKNPAAPPPATAIRTNLTGSCDAVSSKYYNFFWSKRQVDYTCARIKRIKMVVEKGLCVDGVKRRGDEDSFRRERIRSVIILACLFNGFVVYYNGGVLEIAHQ